MRARCGYVQGAYRQNLPWAWKCVVRGGIGVLRFPLRMEFTHCPQCHLEVQNLISEPPVRQKPRAVTDQEWALLHVVQANPGITWPAILKSTDLPEHIARECLTGLQARNLIARLPDLGGQGQIRLGPGPALGSVLEHEKE